MKLFDTYMLGHLSLSNRIVMAPMTRSRAIDNIPNTLMKTYYEQRATAGLIITEGTSPSPNGLGYARIPGAYNNAQLEGWKAIAEGVHKKNGKIFVQLMHTGRVTAAQNLPEGAETLAPSAIPLGGEMYTDSTGMQPHTIAKEMSSQDIETVKQEFVTSTSKLIAAGIDGVELHSANGYLLDQFLNPRTNTRTDSYGGSYKNRARLLLEILTMMDETIGLDKIGVRFSPYGVFNDMEGDYEDLVDAYTYLAKELSRMGVAYIHIADQREALGDPEFKTDIKKTIRAHFKGTIIVGGGYRKSNTSRNLISGRI